MGTLYIDRKGVELRQEGPRLLVYEHAARTGSVPLPHVERVVLYGGARLDTGVLRALAGLAEIIDSREDDARAYPLPASPRAVGIGRSYFPPGIILVDRGRDLLTPEDGV